MNSTTFMKGVGLGMVAGATVGMVVAKNQKKSKSFTNKALKTAGEVMGSISDAITK